MASQQSYCLSVLIYDRFEIKMTNMIGCRVNTIIPLRASMVRIRENPFLLPTLCAKFIRNDLNDNMDFSVPISRRSSYLYLDCSDLHNGFARVKCKDCNHEYLVAFSCKRRQVPGRIPEKLG